MSHDSPVSAPRLPTPPGACDTHMHIYGPEYKTRADASHPSIKSTFPDEGKLLDLLADWTDGDENLRRQILVANPAALYTYP